MEVSENIEKNLIWFTYKNIIFSTEGLRGALF